MIIELSNRQLSTLLHYAHIGASSRAKEYRERYPTRKSPYDKVSSIEKRLHDQGFFRG